MTCQTTQVAKRMTKTAKMLHGLKYLCVSIVAMAALEWLFYASGIGFTCEFHLR
jgi:hypothetical protein